MEFFVQNLAPIMFAGLIFFLLLGFPVAFSLGACGLFFAFIGVELNVLPEALLQALPLRIFGIMQNDTLLAIPFFTLMGLILERSGMACSRASGKTLSSTPMKAKNRPQAPRLNATGKPSSRKKMSPTNMMGARF